MSFFSNALSQALDEKGWTATRYAEEAKLHKSRVSRWINGIKVKDESGLVVRCEYIAPEAGSLAEIVKPFDLTQKATIVAAYLRDIIADSAPGLVHVALICDGAVLFGGSVAEQGADYLTKPRPPDGLSDALLSQIYRVAELARDVPEIAAIFREFDHLIQRKQLRNLPLGGGDGLFRGGL